MSTDIAAAHLEEFESGDERIIIACAPGRLNLMGEHCLQGTGLYLALGMDRIVRVAVNVRKDNALRFHSVETCERKRTTISNINYKREDRWANHIKLALCLFSGFGCAIRGMNWTISSNIPQNVGLGAARAIELASALALRRLFNFTISDSELVLRLAALRKDYSGKPSAGTSDEASAFSDYAVMMNSRKDHVILVDEAASSYQKLKFPIGKCKILIVDSKVPYISAESELSARQHDLERGFEMLCKRSPAQDAPRSLRDFCGCDLLDLMSPLSEDVRRRSMHVIKEYERIYELCEAIGTGDNAAIARTIFHSHESLRDLYEVTCPELDWLVKRAQEVPGSLGARMTGKGFGGCVYALIPAAGIDAYISKMDDYERIFGFHPICFEIKSGQAARVLK